MIVVAASAAAAVGDSRGTAAAPVLPVDVLTLMSAA